MNVQKYLDYFLHILSGLNGMGVSYNSDLGQERHERDEQGNCWELFLGREESGALHILVSGNNLKP